MQNTSAEASGAVEKNTSKEMTEEFSIQIHLNHWYSTYGFQPLLRESHIKYLHYDSQE